MKKKFIFIILSLFICVQCWFLFIIFRYPYLGINVKQNEMKEWVIEDVDSFSGVHLLLQKGDIVAKINGINPDDYFSVIKWGDIEQADTVEVVRNGESLKIITTQIKSDNRLDFQAILAEIICFFFSALLYIKIKNSKSARLLSLLFLTIGLTFMGLGASVRGNGLGKEFIPTFLI